jgi:predicted transcriptional regulator
MSKIPIVRISDVMSNKYTMVDGMATIAEASIIAMENDAHCLIVAQRNEDDEYGILLLSDIAKQVLAKNKSANRVNVYEVMTKPVISVRPDMDIRYCARLFEQFDLNIAPVIKGGIIHGVVSYKELVLNGLCKHS